ncbi:MAG: hypothetical protein J6V82_03715, partial [Clostridia bacterium]|nr:hypothetical protein [Clostridia bacterium]
MTLHKMFTDNMVLQANKPVRIFGQGSGVAKVRFCGKTYIVCTQNDAWEIAMPPMPYGGPYDMEVTLNGVTQTLKNVMLGEVILCAGQSNMQFAVKEEIIDPSYVFEAYPAMRTFVQERISPYEGIKSENGWVVCDKKTLGDWSAIGYHVARLLYEKKGIAVGIIGCYQGASIIESWIKETLISAPAYHVPKHLRRFNETHPAYKERSLWNVYGKLYREVFAKILPYAVGSIVWYQGESNSSVAESEMYPAWLKLLADSWRADLRDPSIPFVIMQIATYDGIK